MSNIAPHFQEINAEAKNETQLTVETEEERTTEIAKMPYQVPIIINSAPFSNIDGFIQKGSNGKLNFKENLIVDRCWIDCKSCQNIGYSKLTFFSNGDLKFEKYKSKGGGCSGHEEVLENYLEWRNLRAVEEKYIVVDVVKKENEDFQKTLLLNSNSYLCFDNLESMIDLFDCQRDELARNIYGIGLGDEAVRNFYGIGLGYLQDPRFQNIFFQMETWMEEAYNRNPQVYENIRFSLNVD